MAKFCNLSQIWVCSNSPDPFRLKKIQFPISATGFGGYCFRKCHFTLVNIWNPLWIVNELLNSPVLSFCTCEPRTAFVTPISLESADVFLPFAGTERKRLHFCVLHVLFLILQVATLCTFKANRFLPAEVCAWDIKDPYRTFCYSREIIKTTFGAQACSCDGGTKTCTCMHVTVHKRNGYIWA